MWAVSKSEISIQQLIRCQTFPCKDIDHGQYLISTLRINPDKVRLILISEAAPPDPLDHYYAGEDAAYARTISSSEDYPIVDICGPSHDQVGEDVRAAGAEAFLCKDAEDSFIYML